MDPLSPVVECPPTDVFQFCPRKRAELTKNSRKSSHSGGVDDNDELSGHSDCDEEARRIRFTPGPLIYSKIQIFNDLNVCWECEAEDIALDSPSKRKLPVHRVSSLDSRAQLKPIFSALGLHRNVSDGFRLPFRPASNVHRVESASAKQENIPYSLAFRPLLQCDGASDSGEHEVSQISPTEESPWPHVTMDKLSQGTPPASQDGQCLRTPPTSPELGQHTRPSLRHSVDLTLPDFSALPDSSDLFSDIPTPLTRASPAMGAFPFPSPEHNKRSLTPLTPRYGASPIRPSQRLSSASTRSRSLTPSRRPDRFIPARQALQSSRESLQITRAVSKLSSAEKITRSKESGLDPFSRNIPRTPPRTTGRSRVAGASSVPLLGPNNVLGVRGGIQTSGTRQISHGAVWNVGGSAALSDSVSGVSDGRRGLLASGTNAPLYSSNFLVQKNSASSELDVHEKRVALALDLDSSSRVLNYQSPSAASAFTAGSSSSSPSPGSGQGSGSRIWQNSEWVRKGSVSLLDAPSLRDDFYCSLLAYSHTAKCLAVGLGSHVYLWSESQSSDTPDSLRTPYTAHVSSLAFSSTQGEKSILAIGQADGRILLWNPCEQESRFDSIQPSPVCCVAFRPTTVKRPSIRDPYIMVDTEELLIGDENGHVYFYSVEWPTHDQRELFAWPGALTLHVRMTGHTQQICGLAWSTDGEWFASGGNDNVCHLYETAKVLQQAATDSNTTDTRSHTTLFNTRGSQQQTIDLSRRAFTMPASTAKHMWSLQAAVKAIAFCPWQRGLLAVGGGSNDRCIHFYHTISGACLATIDCSAQVTSLVWSTTRREIAATFGFAQPDHPYRIAVFAWPSCEQIVAIPWYDEHRALYAISYPGGPNIGRTRGEGGMWWSRTQEEGCLVVATSDFSIKFHEIWAEEKKATASKGGLLGGSDILENLHGIEKVGEVIH